MYGDVGHCCGGVGVAGRDARKRQDWHDCIAAWQCIASTTGIDRSIADSAILIVRSSIEANCRGNIRRGRGGHGKEGTTSVKLCAN